MGHRERAGRTDPKGSDAHGRMFGLPLFRRHFESNVLLLAPTTRPYPRDGSVNANRRRSVPTEFLSLYGNFPGVERARVLGLPWMDQRGLAQCIPPQYASSSGRQILGSSMGRLRATYDRQGRRAAGGRMRSRRRMSTAPTWTDLPAERRNA